VGGCEGTRTIVGRGKAAKGDCAKWSFDSGPTVHVWYRREVGQNVLHEVSIKGTPAAFGVVCKQGCQ